ncbi:hypothetical protein [Crateriforma conspicua]|uniref:hypothetical protein n=1 Tax=Crateriforma conspicua TaxID=2527996 RepID=UPI00118C241D|nr:hypothetical protein [Crateriforma conspicua]QDV61969.1 hypothetical protein Mal65_10970 [Crateriforma conspicua]
MSKKIKLTTRSNAASKPEADAWVDEAGDGKSTTNQSKPVRLTFDLDRELHTKLRRYCFDQEIHVSAFVRCLIRDSVE